MKSLEEMIKESLFDIEDNINSEKGIIYNDEKLEWKIWRECQKSFEWFRNDIIKNSKTFTFEEYGIRSLEHDIIYNESDCILMTDKNNIRITIMCPETIWYNYVKDSLSEIQTSGDSIDEKRPRCGFYCMTFAKNRYGHFYPLEYCRSKYFGYVPETVSDKARKIIERF